MAPQQPKKKRVKVTRVVDGHPIDEWIEVDDIELAWPARSELEVLNKDQPRVDGPLKVTGRAVYTHDVRMPGMLYGRLLLCPVPRADVSVDVAPALELAGVAAAIVLEDERTSFLGQPVAAVAARTPELAEDAIRAIAFTYEELDWALDREQALAEGAPIVPRRGDSNRRVASTKGDKAEAETALMQCDEIVEATYTLPVQHHVSLETHGMVVDYRGDEATIHISTQWVQGAAGQAARALDLPADKIHVICEHMGGGFGAKFQFGVEGLACCKLAREAMQPVQLMLTRRDEFLIAGNRSGSWQRLVGGVTGDGRFVALLSEVDRLGGLGRGSHPGQPYIYKVETSSTEMASVFTHTDANRAMRAPGHPQASFAIESMVDELAYAIAMDPVEFRKRNLEDPVYARQLDEVAKKIGWDDHPHKTAPGKPDDEGGSWSVGIGFGVSTWGGGGAPKCEVDVEVHPDGSVTSSVGSQDLGTGTRTYVAGIPAEEFGLTIADVNARIGDNHLGDANGSGGSTTTASLAPAVKHAAHEARLRFVERIARTLDCPPERVKFAGGRVFDAEDETKGLSWKQACRALGALGVVGHGTFQQGLQTSGARGAQAVKVRVDTLTGRIEVLDMVCVQDVGLPLNRMAVRSQLQGGMVQALSYGLLEERVLDRDLGLMLNAGMEEYKIAGSLDIPLMTAVIDDADTRQQVMGVGEPAAIPGHSALANAVHNACGARVRDLPLTPDKVLAALERDV